ncbi:dihydrofolate reductase [Limimonas halophila]|uniref:Dihydrofolate reductase n=1 Tax=Limimonas halophila TaxID=1082479 RepID=A0A1G7PX35_9PROT|nr:dihydrofolate reductase [Limimonas halophila]SDF90793.1 dihydrofolate reductase [Limimonas halophila]
MTYPANDPKGARVTIVLAADDGDGIGQDGGLPWHLPGDLAFFKRVTRGHPVVMGRTTHDAIGRALPGRTNVVVSRNPAYQPAEGCVLAGSLDEGLAQARAAPGGEDIMVIGGAAIFEQALSYADVFYLTRVHASFPADTALPDPDWASWRETWRDERAADDANAHPHTFLRYERVS